MKQEAGWIRQAAGLRQLKARGRPRAGAVLRQKDARQGEKTSNA